MFNVQYRNHAKHNICAADGIFRAEIDLRSGVQFPEQHRPDQMMKLVP